MPQDKSELNKQNSRIAAALKSLDVGVQQPRVALPSTPAVPTANRATQNATEAVADRLAGAKKK